MDAISGRLLQAGREETGAVAAITAILLTALLALLAFVVDFGLVRADTRHSQNAADSASAAGIDALSENGDHQEACQAAVAYLEVHLGVTVSSDFCDPFDADVFNAIDCDARAASTLPPTTDPTIEAPVYVERRFGDHTIRIQMPVRHAEDPGASISDDAMGQQAYDSSFDGEEPCRRITVSVRRHRSLIFGQFAGASGDVSGIADAVSRYHIERREEEIPSLVVLDRDGCESLVVQSNNGRLIVENLEDGAGDVVQQGLISVDTDGRGCGNNKYVMVAGGAGARLCAGVDPDRVIEDPPSSGNFILAPPGFCESDPETLRTPSRRQDVTVGDPYGKSVRWADIDGRRVEPKPIYGEQIKRRPVDHQFNCRDEASGFYPKSADSGDEWHPLYEEDIEDCQGRAANMDELLDDLAEGGAFAAAPSWQTVSGGDCTIGPGDDRTIGDGTRNLYFDCDPLKIAGRLRIHTDQYIVVSGWIDARGALEFAVNANDVGNVDGDAVLVIQGRKSGTDEAIWVDAELANINRTMVYAHVGSTKVTADEMHWTAPAPDTPGYDPDTGAPDSCVEQTTFGTPPSEYDLPSPECFHKLALWSNNTGLHSMTGGGQLDLAGVFFSPYAGRVGTTDFRLSGGSGERLTKAQFFTYRFRLVGGSLLSMRPDPEFNIFTDGAVYSLIR